MEQWIVSLNVEAMDLYRILDFKSYPRNSSHFEMNFKRTINCPSARANMNELTGVISAL